MRNSIMKKSFLFALTLGALVIPGVVLAADPAPSADVYQQDTNGNWKYVTMKEANARLFKESCGELSGNCNKQTWTVQVTTKASVAQWINWRFSDNIWSWQVKKPGIYAGDCMKFWIQSNADVNVDFRDFENLRYDDNNFDYSIPVWYGYTETGVKPPAEDSDWFTPDQLNNMDLKLSYADISGAAGKQYSLWNKIEIDPSTHACNYSASGFVDLKVSILKDFIDPNDGTWIKPNAEDCE